MTESEMFIHLNDNEFKIWKFIDYWRKDIKSYIPDIEYIAENLNKNKRTVFRAIAGLKEKGVLPK